VFNDRGGFEWDARITSDVNVGIVVATLGYWRQLKKGLLIALVPQNLLIWDMRQPFRII